ncbi:MAG TPA: hypothetical protein VFA65_20515 [Bryobacteraceae bacterium]|nr:hypothetical protein [Bryobacteraceae bacterium]
MKKKKINKDNAILIALCAADQRDRVPNFYKGNEFLVSKRDQRRRTIVSALIRRAGLNTASDFYNAALIFQHGSKERDYKLAQNLAHKALRRGHEGAPWLFAAATDRLLLEQGKKQKFGTQFELRRVNRNQRQSIPKFVISRFDRRTSDRTRIQFGVPRLRQLLRMAKTLS